MLANKRKLISDLTELSAPGTMVENVRRAAKGKKKACFVVLDGLDIGQIIEIKNSVVSVGRDPNCDVVFQDDSLSRMHVEVRYFGTDHIAVRDLDSTNGTFVDGKRITETILRDGDKMLLGRSTLVKFILQDKLDETAQRQLYESSFSDELTGLYNRKYFNQKIDQDLSFAERHKIPISLFILDIDHFKKVNDTLGHPAGDQVLVSVSDVIGSMTRAEDTLARYGGEEFAIISPGTNLAGAQTLGERIRAGVEAHQTSMRDEAVSEVQVTISIGVCTLMPGKEIKSEDLIEAADKNLYAAKEGGRNIVVAYPFTSS